MTEHAHKFPVVQAILVLTAAALGGGLVCAAVGSALMETALLVPVVTVATLIPWVAVVLAVLPLAVVGPRGVSATIGAFMIGTGIRLPVCLILGYVLAYRFSMPAAPLLLSMVGLYMCLLIAEVALVGRYLTQKDRLTGGFSTRPTEVIG